MAKQDCTKTFAKYESPYSNTYRKSIAKVTHIADREAQDSVRAFYASIIMFSLKTPTSPLVIDQEDLFR